MQWCTRQAGGRPSETLQSQGRRGQGRKEALTVKCSKFYEMKCLWLWVYLLVYGVYGSLESNVEEGDRLEGVP